MLERPLILNLQLAGLFMLLFYGYIVESLVFYDDFNSIFI